MKGGAIFGADGTLNADGQALLGNPMVTDGAGGQRLATRDDIITNTEFL